ncbi:metal ABC transporter solute-binding protein, Zn/Mn family [Shewanella donghaensis]|uniref:metal ABC transporter solute-binding protein, Zn/Mn family n=1 Tax=Shewanella donghaensis TaxID=238836 RepID=UPI001183AA4E|nr:zinc ABC transporter substrate-binding protein [Shewanella donghaensis]
MRINSKKVIIAATLLAGLVSSSANAAFNVFACEPEYAALTEALAPNAKVYSATSALQDPHQVQARPSLIAKMRQADLVVCAGADLEIGWLPMLQMKASNNKVLSTDTGLFYAAEHIETLDQLTQVDRSMGDVHAKGNPHLHFDPRKFLKVAQALSAKLTELDPSSAAEYQASLAEFTEQWQQAIPRWEEKAQQLKGKKVIAYHSSFRYLFNWLAIEQVADLEPKPGLPPSSSHLAKLVNRGQQGDIMAIVVASYQDERGANWLGERTDLPVVVVPMSVGGNDQSHDLISLYDSVLTILTEVE